MFGWTISFFCVVFVFCSFAMVFAIYSMDAQDSNGGAGDDYDGGGGGGGGGGSFPSPRVPQPQPLPNPEHTTVTPAIETMPHGIGTPLTDHVSPTATHHQQTPPSRPPPTTPAVERETTTMRIPTATTRTTTRRARTTTRRTRTTTRTRTRTTRKPHVAQPMPYYAYLCTVTQPMRSNEAYLPPDGMCDYMFYDSLYKNGKNSLPSGVSTFEPDTRYFIEQASKYSKTKFGLSFAAEYALLKTDYKDPAFNTVIDALWGYEVSHFGFLDLYQEYALHDTVKEALTVLKAIHVHLLAKTSSRPSYYVVGISFDGAAEDRVLSLMKTVFTPSMFISSAHLSYSVRAFRQCRMFPVAMAVLPEGIKRGIDYTYGHTVNESLSVLRQLDKMGFAIPTAISFSLKGVYYAPRISSPNSPKEHEFLLFEPCVDFHTPNFDDPKTLCGNPDWTPQAILHEMAYSLKLKRMMTYLTESMISTLACDVKQFNLNLNFGIAAYDVDYDRAAPCKDFGFKTLGSSYSRVANTREVMNFFRTNYTKPTDNFVCQMMFTAYDRFM